MESTRVKILSAYEDTKRYVEEQLLVEQAKLAEALKEDAIGQDKADMFKRYTELGTVQELYSKIKSFENDMRELEGELAALTTTKKSINDDEMKSLLENDLSLFDAKLERHKLELIDMLVPEELEDKQNAVLELSAGVGGLESRIFCAELYEMYRLYASSMSWTFVPLKVDTENNEKGEMMRQARVELNGVDVFKYMKFESGN
jgi:peptide chain release factor 1